MIGLTKRQAQVLEAIKELTQKHAMAPARMEIAEAVGLRSQAAVDTHLAALARKGYISQVHGSPRSVVVNEARATQTLGERDLAIWDFVKVFTAGYGYAPTRTKIAEAVGLKSHASVGPYLRRLVEAGHIEIDPGTIRGLRVRETNDIPLVDAGNSLADNEPLLCKERIVARVPGTLVDRFRPRPDFLLKIHDDGLSEVGVMVYDAVAVQATEEADDGDIVVARLADRLCYGRMRRTAEREIEIVPMSANPGQRPIRINLDAGEGVIEGVIIGRLVARPLAL